MVDRDHAPRPAPISQAPVNPGHRIDVRAAGRFVEIPSAEIIRIAGEAKAGANGEGVIHGVAATLVPEHE